MLNRGDKIGQYTLVSKVGSGGFGDVWKAERRTVLDVNYFALKFFRPKEDRIDFDKISKELAVWKQLKGLPHIISVIELDQFEDYIYVVSDFADGGSLENWLRINVKASSVEQAVKITLEILTGLENLHDKGFVHRDLKPDNILIMNGKVCLADFGISREVKTHSKATGTAGTMEYMPPEAFAKTPSVTPQTDIWAVGVILQKLLTGSLPYPQDDQPSLIAAILMSEPDEMPESIPESLREIVKKALRKDRENRFVSAREMYEALRNPELFLTTIRQKSLIQSTIEDVETQHLPPQQETEDWEKIQKQRAFAQTEKLEIAHETQPWEGTVDELTADELEVVETNKDKHKKEERDDQRRKISKYILAVIFLILFGIPVAMFIQWSLPKTNYDYVPITINNSNQPINTPVNKPTNVSPPPNSFPTFKNSIGMEFIKIPSGTFMMGSPESEKGRNPDEGQHQVTISNSFYLGKYEVTQGQWKSLMGNNPSKFSGCGDNCPVESISWQDIDEFIKKLNEKNEGTYRLPTEAEWEYACRAGTISVYSGNNLDEIGWYEKNSDDRTHPVGQKKSNAWGLYDMHGNVYERTKDWYGNYPNGSVVDPKGQNTGVNSVVRGGSWGGSAENLRSATRSSSSPTFRLSDSGFRLVREN